MQRWVVQLARMPRVLELLRPKAARLQPPAPPSGPLQASESQGWAREQQRGALLGPEARTTLRCPQTPGVPALPPPSMEASNRVNRLMPPAQALQKARAQR
jgi:hypothetical protein